MRNECSVLLLLVSPALQFVMDLSGKSKPPGASPCSAQLGKEPLHGPPDPVWKPCLEGWGGACMAGLLFSSRFVRPRHPTVGLGARSLGWDCSKIRCFCEAPYFLN